MDQPGPVLGDIPSMTSFSKIVPLKPREETGKKADISGKNKKAPESEVGKKQEEKETDKPWAAALVEVSNQSDKAIPPVKSESVGVAEAKSHVNKNTANDVQSQSVNPVETKKESTSVNAERTSTEDPQSRTTKPAESTKETTVANLASNSDQHAQPVLEGPVESKEESITVQIPQGASLTTTSDGSKQGATAGTMKNQYDVVETKQHEDTPLIAPRSRGRASALTEAETEAEAAKRVLNSVQVMDSLADIELMTPINDDSKQEIPDSVANEKEIQYEVIEVQQNEDNAQPPAQTSSADTPHVQPLESKEESTNVHTTGEVADKALTKPKNDDRNQDDNVQVIARGISEVAPHEVRIPEEDWVGIEIHGNAETKTEEVKNLEVETAEPVVQIKEPDAYQQIKFDETYEPDSNIEVKEENYANYLSSSIEPINPDAPNCDVDSRRSSLLSDSHEQLGGTIFRMRSVVALLATVAIASALFGLYSFVQQRE